MELQDLIVDADGTIYTVYGEGIDYRELGQVEIRRASHVEPASGADWAVDLTPVHGPAMGPFPSRTEALDAEYQWLRDHEDQWITSHRKELNHETNRPNAKKNI
jgi:hypothetical protein